MKWLIVLIVLALVLGSEIWPQKPAPALVGFSFSPLASEQAHSDPRADLARLLDATHPDVVRLPVYWELVQPTPEQLDFASVDEMLDVIAEHNQASPALVRVVLTIGARNFLFPELHQPAWAGPREQPNIDAVQSATAYRKYFDASITRYRSSPLLYAWQVENEPLDKVVNAYTGYDVISDGQLAWEVAEAHRLDPGRRVVITSFNALNSTLDIVQAYTPQLLFLVGGPSGHPNEALAAGDAFGLDIYLDGPYIPWRSFTTIALRSQWKQQSIAFWAGRAHAQGKEVWLTEMQAQPWGATETFTPADLLASAVDYRQEPLDVALLWGVETWLADPEWLVAGRQAIDILRAR
ncbi:MAG TPA: hypothetical protein VEM94_01020 [Candidatus Dormibacteraeota bacterium]|nr:hypothetical protein [Candidatus Dormibacteraeota bacterium]